MLQKLKEFENRANMSENQLIDREKEILRLKNRLEAKGLDLDYFSKQGEKQE